MKTSRIGRIYVTARSVLTVALLLVFANAGMPAEFQPGIKFEELTVGKITYHHVQVRSVSARTLMISHDGGMASVHLRDLAPDLQAKFGYSAEADAAAEMALVKTPSDQKPIDETRQKGVGERSKTGARSPQLEQLLQQFGQPPEIRPSVDLRPQFLDLALNVKNQGPRPSCAVFAVVSALEFQNAQAAGKPEQFSEEYLIWATSKLLGRTVPSHPGGENEGTESLDTVDVGFALSDVVTALRAYGIPLQSSVPYTYSRTAARFDPPAQVVEAAKTHTRVSILPLPGHDQAAQVGNLIQALDHGVPVPVGLQWPLWRALRTGYINTQIPQPTGGHAVTVVGYENKTGLIKDTVFIFKNSWGVRWGTGGYGFVTYRYLVQYLTEAVVLDVAPESRK